MKTENLKIAIFPIGSAVRFRKENLKRADGTLEYFNLFYALARNAKVAEVWIMQKSDWSKLTFDEKVAVDPRGVIRDIYGEFKVVTPPGRRQGPDGLVPYTKEEMELYKDLWEKIKDLEQPDFGIGFAAQGFTMVNIPGIIPSIKNPSKMTGALDMTTIYSAPVIHWLNMSKVPWFLVLNDPRYVKKQQKWRDLVNGPRGCIAQYNDTIDFTHFDTYPNPASGKEITEKLELTYSGIEKLNLVNHSIIPPTTDRDIKFALVAMQSAYGKAQGDYRLDVIKKYILNSNRTEGYNIYGKWDDRFTNGYTQFQGYRSPQEIDDIMAKTRYTLVIPIRPHWVTSKYAEMLRVGVVPFLHPDYDTQYSTIPKNHYVRVSTPEELHNKIQELEENPEMRIKLVKDLQIRFLLGVRTGDFLADLVNNFLEKYEVPVRMTKGISEEILRVPTLQDFEDTPKKKENIQAKTLF